METARQMFADLDVEEWAWDLAIGGVNHSIPGNGGDECREFIPYWQRYIECAIFIPTSLVCMWNLLPTLNISFSKPPRDVSRYWVLTLYSLVFGAELAFKMISRTGIFLLNPCHITTMMQLALLSMDPNQPLTCWLFRGHLYLVPGALFALAFPILNTRLLPGEVFIYYVQHIAILIIPVYLSYIRGAFEPEPLNDIAWPTFGILFIMIYHFAPLQFMALWTNVNLNNIMCPAISDPFGTRFYRIFAIFHQSLLVPLIAKTHALVGAMLVDTYQELFDPAPQPLKVECAEEQDAL